MKVNVCDILQPLRDPSGVDVRLAGGSDEHAGRVEVFLNGSWGTICNDNWNLQAANVVCRQLGFPGAISSEQAAGFGEGSGPTHLNGVDCGGDEVSILECSHDGVGNHDCSHLEGAGVICRTSDEPGMQMPDGATGRRQAWRASMLVVAMGRM